MFLSVSVCLSASVERFIVSRMRDFGHPFSCSSLIHWTPGVNIQSEVISGQCHQRQVVVQDVQITVYIVHCTVECTLHCSVYTVLYNVNCTLYSVH